MINILSPIYIQASNINKRINYIEDEPRRSDSIIIQTKADFYWVDLTLDNKAVGLLTSRIRNNATVVFSNGVFKVSGNLQDVNHILTDLIFVPNENFVENFNISIKIRNLNNFIIGKI